MSAILEHPRYRETLELLSSAANDLTRGWNGALFRCVELKWARPEFLISGQGTMRYGGRWMRRDVTPVVHAASSEAISLKESRRTADRYRIRLPPRKPRVSVEIRARFHHLADLTRIEDLLDWPSLNELLTENWEGINARGLETLSQAFGRALWELKFEGLLVPSARDRRGRNIVWFPKNFSASAQLQISGERELTTWITPNT